MCYKLSLVFCSGFVCQCKHKSNGLVPGPLCEETTRTFDRDLGKSYIWLHTLAAYERNVVTLEFMTIVAEGLILYQGPLLEGFESYVMNFK